MRFSPSSSGSEFRNRFVGLGAVALLAAGISACGSNNNSKPDGGSSSDAKPDTGSDARADLRPDIRPDLPPVDTTIVNPLCQGVAPTTDYSDPYVVANFDGFNDSTFSAFGSGDPINGGTYPTGGYPNTDFSGQNWHITGIVGPADDAHFGIYWTCALATASGGCTLDVSRFKGISFKVKGYAGPDNQMTLSLGRAENDPSVANAGCGSCVLPASSDAAIGDYCRGPRATFSVPADGSEKTVTVLWTDFADGSPHASIDPHQVTGILWIFHNPPSPDGGTDGGGAADAPMSTDDGGASDAGMCGADGDVCEAGAPDAGAAGGDDAGSDAGGPGYAADLTVDDITLVPF